MDREPDYILEIQGLDADTDGERSAPVSDGARRWVGVRFDCCGVYLRIYRNRAGTAYEGTCPHCGRRVSVRIGPDGTRARLFRAV